MSNDQSYGFRMHWSVASFAPSLPPSFVPSLPPSFTPSLPPSLLCSLSLLLSLSLLSLCLSAIFCWQKLMMIRLQSFYFVKLHIFSGRMGMESHITVYLILILLLILLWNLIDPISNSHQNLKLISNNELMFEVDIGRDRLSEHLCSKTFD